MSFETWMGLQPRNNTNWPETEDAHLKKLWLTTERSISSIAAEHGRGYSGIEHRLVKLFGDNYIKARQIGQPTQYKTPPGDASDANIEAQITCKLQQLAAHETNFKTRKEKLTQEIAELNSRLSEPMAMAFSGDPYADA